jgi:hypothetical protein
MAAVLVEKVVQGRQEESRVCSVQTGKQIPENRGADNEADRSNYKTVQVG